MPRACAPSPVVGGAYYYTFKTLYANDENVETPESTSSLIAPYIQSPSSLVGLLSILQIDPSYSSTGTLRPVDNNSAAACARRTFSARRAQKISVPKRDGHTYIHTYIQTQNEMRSKISCLALRRSAIIIIVKSKRQCQL